MPLQHNLIDMTTEKLVIGKKNYSLLSESDLEARVETFIATHGIPEDQPLPLERIKKEDPSLSHQLQLYSYKLSAANSPDEKGHFSLSRSLRHMGYFVTAHLSTEEIDDLIRQMVSYEIAEKVYKGEWEIEGGLRGLVVAGAGDNPRKKKLARQAYDACFNRARKDYHKDKLVHLIDSLYPELKARYKCPLSEAMSRSLTSGQIALRLREIYFSGGDLSARNVERREGGYTLVSNIKRRDLPGRLNLGESYDRKLSTYLDLKLSPEDLLLDNEDARRGIGTILERQLLLGLEILRTYKISPRQVGEEFLDFFPGEVLELYPPHRQDIRTTSTINKEADARVVMPGLELLVEVKSYRHFNGSEARRVIDSYQDVKSWKDGAPIGRKMALAIAPDLSDDARRQFSQRGWKLMDGPTFSRFYQRCLTLLEEREPDFFRTALMPVPDVKVITEVNDLVCNKPHMLYRRGFRELRHWYLHWLAVNRHALCSGERVPHREMPNFQYVKPFSDFQEEYQGREQIKHEGVLFLDLETTGFQGRNSPITLFNIGLAYYDPGREEMVSEVLFSRNPGEEKVCLQQFLERVKGYSHIVTFNGNNFDMRVLQHRLYVNCLDYSLSNLKHDDLFGNFYREYDIPAGEKRPSRTLQSYERNELNFLRKKDIPGRDVPRVYHDFLYGKDSLVLPQIVLHNHLDVVTLAIMYDQYKDRLPSSTLR